jgi:phage shock protein A
MVHLHIHHHYDDRLDRIIKLLEQIMAAIDTLKTDLAALIAEAVKDLTAAVAAAQAASQDPAIDALDAQVKDATTTLQTKFAELTGTPVPPAP